MSRPRAIRKHRRFRHSACSSFEWHATRPNSRGKLRPRNDGHAFAIGSNGHGQCVVPELPPGLRHIAACIAGGQAVSATMFFSAISPELCLFVCLFACLPGCFAVSSSVSSCAERFWLKRMAQVALAFRTPALAAVSIRPPVSGSASEHHRRAAHPSGWCSWKRAPDVLGVALLLLLHRLLLAQDLHLLLQQLHMHHHPLHELPHLAAPFGQGRRSTTSSAMPTCIASRHSWRQATRRRRACRTSRSTCSAVLGRAHISSSGSPAARVSQAGLLTRCRCCRTAPTQCIARRQHSLRHRRSQWGVWSHAS